MLTHFKQGQHAACSFTGKDWITSSDPLAVTCENCIRTAHYNQETARALRDAQHVAKTIDLAVETARRTDADEQVTRGLMEMRTLSQYKVTVLEIHLNQSARQWCQYHVIVEARTAYRKAMTPEEAAA